MARYFLLMFPYEWQNHSFLSFLQVPRLVKVVLETSPYFKLTSPGGVCCKVAPGMCSTFQIQFTPEENKDYFYQLTCITEREKFIVPIRAIGARAILDFPDQLNFSVCPVKYSSQKTLLVRNIGNREARYRISTESPFSVDPSIGTLGIGDATQVTVEFHPLKTGDHSSSLVVRYDTVANTNVFEQVTVPDGYQQGVCDHTRGFAVSLTDHLLRVWDVLEEERVYNF
ncbi:hydrocephalus-inducing protein homolog [Strix aluco]|uniref:hydrocephalus-inducing protein homolog n=1 Tax=Strix aluco TaxID=111821 RepID=UPI003DA4CB59